MNKEERIKQEEIVKQNFYEIIRFGIVGVIATIIHYGIYLALNLIILSWIAYSIGYGISFLCNFYLSNRFTFKTKPTFKNGVGFGLSHFINYLLQVILLSVFIKLGVSDKYAPIPVFCIAVPVNFLMVRFVLKSKSKSHVSKKNYYLFYIGIFLLFIP